MRIYRIGAKRKGSPGITIKDVLNGVLLAAGKFMRVRI
jgi:hypothetical protein